MLLVSLLMAYHLGGPLYVGSAMVSARISLLVDHVAIMFANTKWVKLLQERAMNTLHLSLLLFKSSPVL